MRDKVNINVRVARTGNYPASSKRAKLGLAVWAGLSRLFCDRALKAQALGPRTCGDDEGFARQPDSADRDARSRTRASPSLKVRCEGSKHRQTAQTNAGIHAQMHTCTYTHMIIGVHADMRTRRRADTTTRVPVLRLSACACPAACRRQPPPRGPARPDHRSRSRPARVVGHC